MTDVKFDLTEFEEKLARFINENAEQIAKQIATDARATTEFQDYKGTARESEWSKKTWGSNARKLRRSIRAKESKFEDGGWIVQATAPHAHLIEYGHDIVTKDGRKVGRAQPRSFLRKALNDNIAAARNAFGAR
jgi:hypothetical protein